MSEELKITRRHLPHWTIDGAIYFVTFCTNKTVFDEDEQRIILKHIKEGDGKFYDCYAAMVMPDHVHLLLQPKEGMTLSRIMHGIKGVSAHKINQHRNTKGAIWQKESFDRILRDGKEFDEKLNYMYNNPIKKELTENTENYVGWYCNEDKC
jgi:REP element-mobilizing transposase RayT